MARSAPLSEKNGMAVAFCRQLSTCLLYTSYLLGKVQIVRSHDDGAASLRMVTQGTGDDAAAGQVQTLGGLIEQ